MQFTLNTTQTLPIDPGLTWIIYSEQTRSFLVGDGKKAFSLPIDRLGSPADITADPASNSCNLPISAAFYDEFRKTSWHGLQFLDAASDQRAPAGNLICTLVFLPDYGHCVLHPATGTILRFKSGSIQLVASDFSPLENSKTRGKAALAFAAHPSEGLIAYGDNAGTFHAQRFDASALGKASKIITKDRKASRLEFVKGGSLLVIGGMGYLQTLSYDHGKFTSLHETSIAVRDFLWLKEGQLVLVNQGLHGITAFRYDDEGFAKLAEVRPAGAAQQMAVSADKKYLAVSSQGSPTISVYELL